MPGKRVSIAAGLKAQGPMRKAGRTGEGSGPLVASARRWGSAHWVFEGWCAHRFFFGHALFYDMPACT